MERSCYQDLVAWKKRKDRKPLMLKGARQVGKTFLLEQFGHREFPRTHRINFEKKPDACALFDSDLDPKRIVRALGVFLDVDINISEDLLIFDEIQMCPKAITSLKYFCEDLPEMALCSAGSLLGVHLTPTSYPVGKVDTMDLYPMSFQEFLSALGDERYVKYSDDLHLGSTIPELIHAHLWSRLKLYFVVGGLPEVVKVFRDSMQDLVLAFKLTRKKQNELMTIYLADMAKYCGKVNAMHIQRVFSSVPLQLARNLDGSSSKFIFKGVVPQADRYQQLVGALDWLEGAGLVIKVFIVESAQIPLKAFSKENSFKLMLFDVGILGALSDLPPQNIINYDYGTYKGYFAENFVAQELVMKKGKPLYSWHEGKAEVEFLQMINGEVIPFEVKSGSVIHSKSLSSFQEKYAPPYGVVLSGKTLESNQGKRRQNYPLYLAQRAPFDK